MEEKLVLVTIPISKQKYQSQGLLKNNVITNTIAYKVTDEKRLLKMLPNVIQIIDQVILV